MGVTKLRKNGVDPKKLSDKMMAFCLEYVKDHNGSRAVRDSGYSEKGASVRAVKLLQHPLVKAMVGKLERESRERRQLTTDEILGHLADCARRNVKGLFDKNGVLHLNHRVITKKDKKGKRVQEVEGSTIHDIPDELANAIDGIKQKVRRYVVDDMAVEEVETELKLVSKAAAIEMAMKHKGLFAPDQSKTVISLDWDAMTRPPAVDVDPVQQALDEASHPLLGKEDDV